MKKIEDYKINFKSNDLIGQVLEFFSVNNADEIGKHSIAVAEEAKRLAVIFDLPEEKAYIAGLLHDVGDVIPDNERIFVQLSLNENVFKEEKELPMLLHQKLSVNIAKEVFGITDLEVLSAIETHSTLKKQATQFDKLIFIADKVEWEEIDSAPYLDELKKALEISLDEACRTYINYGKANFILMHPWMKEAMDELECVY